MVFPFRSVGGLVAADIPGSVAGSSLTVASATPHTRVLSASGTQWWVRTSSGQRRLIPRVSLSRRW